MVALLAAFITLPACLNATQPGEAYADFTADGGWCWFSDPRAISDQGKTYAGWITADGSVEVGSLDPRSGEVTTFVIDEAYEKDDHDNPSFLILPDGRLRAFYTRHSNRQEINTRTTRRPGDITEWGPVEVIPPNDPSPRNSGVTYSNPFLLTEEDNAIHLFWRGRSFKPTMATSLDNGETWSTATPVFSLPDLPRGNRPYAKYGSNGKDRIHFIFTDGHPRREPHNSVYYACYRGGAFYRADGTRICTVSELPFPPAQADRVYDASTTGARAWIWEVTADSQDRPVLVYTRHPTESDHRYHYARWTGSAWFDTELCAAGGWFPQTPEGEQEREPHYSSGLALDPQDPSVVYLTRPVNGVRELERWTTSDRGTNWTTTAITSGSKHDNIRPFVVRNHSENGPTVLWQNVSGHYRHYTDYLCSIKMDSPHTVTTTAALGRAQALPPLSRTIEPAPVLAAMERVADWQLAHPSHHRETDWTQGAGDAGMMALAGIAADPVYEEALLTKGRRNEWKLGPRPYHADDHAVGQTYAELYLDHRDPAMIAPMQQSFDRILAAPIKVPSLKFQGEGNVWSWCDSLFMAPTAWLRLHTATGDDRYHEFAVTNWWRTSDYLYDTEEHLYFRDSTYFDKREANGRKIFWSRGNGWVIAGLVRVLQFLPTNDPDRPRFERQFKEMAEALLDCQQPDGLWRSSLLDPEGYPLKEVSGSGFHTYGLAWGVNQGLLDRDRFEPAIRKAWLALVDCIDPTGKLTHIQPIGADPRRFDPNATEVYGVGAFLLAGSELYRLAVLEQADAMTVSVKNRQRTRCDQGLVSIPVKRLPAKPVVLDGLRSRILPAQLTHETLRFQVNLAPRETRDYLIVPATALAGVPTRAHATSLAPDQTHTESRLLKVRLRPVKF